MAELPATDGHTGRAKKVDGKPQGSQVHVPRYTGVGVGMINRLELVLRATLSDGTVLEGATRPQETGILSSEDARVIRELDIAVAKLPLSYDETLATVLLGELRRRPIVDKWPDGEVALDLIDLCLLRLCTKLRDRNDPEPKCQ